MAYIRRSTKDLGSLYHDYHSLMDMAKKNHLTARDIKFLASLPQYEPYESRWTPEQLKQDQRDAKKFAALVAVVVVVFSVGFAMMLCRRVADAAELGRGEGAVRDFREGKKRYGIMGYTKLPTHDLESQGQNLDDLPPYAPPIPQNHNDISSTPELNSSLPPISQLNLNHHHTSLLTLAQTHHLTPQDIQFLAAQPEYGTPAQQEATERTKKVAKWVVGIFLVVWVSGVVGIIVLGVTSG
ncbi:hypothetical protein GLAREA_12025 [Glarea lozoyensis ATCC 20868]|uniref:Uncharacterized protein n=1 Tax=Glarea lozoyensis (strain ATCC 20868 / MF5171) TaxID=1116229 RepID=S3E071_GLAL2|nr:uncharacterized protein GLAREA_12025 [Glarea lozoyensis ATCC 20868]EPE31943.1 hypothetical protein GLAREA_12025 [Glarea lozoyensis ATCC 20868]